MVRGYPRFPRKTGEMDVSNLKKFWEGLAPSDKHLDDRSKWGLFLHREFISRIQTPIRSVLDYGCGGGWTDVPFPADTEFHLVDLCPDNVETAMNRILDSGHTGKIMPYYHFDKFDRPDWPYYKHLVGRIDLLICTLVINHFPSYQYYNDVAERFWQLRPRYMLLHQRHSKETYWQNDFDAYRKKYGIGLTMRTYDFLQPYEGMYDPIIHVLEDETFRFWGTPGYEFVLLKRTE